MSLGVPGIVHAAPFARAARSRSQAAGNKAQLPPLVRVPLPRATALSPLRAAASLLLSRARGAGASTCRRRAPGTPDASGHRAKAGPR